MKKLERNKMKNLRGGLYDDGGGGGGTCCYDVSNCTVKPGWQVSCSTAYTCNTFIIAPVNATIGRCMYARVF